ncbi:MAG: rhomboid family intramembrane serine protease [Oscillospiraceae bacterium]|nr:rhomboid family intramembrane serine protease [Oscillospiraceae bacterium]
MNLIKRIQYNAPVTLTFALISLAALGISFITKGESDIMLFSVYRSSWSDPLAYLRLFTHVLGHAGVDHYLNNFMFILLLGPIIEEKYGPKNMLVLLVLTAFITGIINILFFPGIRLLGASGVVFMFIILGSFVNLKRGQIPVTFLLIAGLYIGREVYYGFSIQDNISRLSHIAGGVCGAGIGYYLNRDKFRG